MRKSIELAFAAAMTLTSMSARAAGPAKELSGREWLAHVPAVPDDALSASKFWVMRDGVLGLAPEIEAFERDLATLSAPPDAEEGAKGMADAEEGAKAMAMNRARAEQMAAEFDSPEGQARLEKMTPAEMQALAQSMMGAPPQAAPSARGGGLAAGDAVALKELAAMTEVGNRTFPAVNAIQQEFGNLKAQWEREEQALGAKELAAIEHLPHCHDEAGLPSTADAGRVHLEYADQILGLASRYLKRAAALQQKMRQTVTPHIDAADHARAAYKRLRSSGARQTASAAIGSAGPLIGIDVGLVYVIAKESSQHAASAVSHKASLKKQYEGAKGC